MVGLRLGLLNIHLYFLLFSVLLLTFGTVKGEVSSVIEECPAGNICGKSPLDNIDRNGFEKAVLEAFEGSDDADAKTFAETYVMGPGYVWCEKIEQFGLPNQDQGSKSYTLFKKSFGDFPKTGEDAGFALRSISKIMVSAAFMALTHQNFIKQQEIDLNLNTKVGTYFSNCGVLEQATIRDLLAMNTTGLDNRITAQIVEKRHKKGIAFDHVGFPSVCDDLGYGIAECVEKLICPAYAEGNEFDNDILDKIPEDTCKNKRNHCTQYAEAGMCMIEPRYMYAFCPGACNAFCCDNEDYKNQCMMMKFDKSLCKTVKNEKGQLIGEKFCRKACGLCSRELELEEYGWHIRFDESSNQVKKSIRINCIYDNYGYTLVDGIVEKATGKDLLHWIVELIMKPLEMKVGLTCMGLNDQPDQDESDVECYRPPIEVDDHVNSALWPKQSSSGLETKTWISNALFSSARDFMTFNLMLMNNGTWNGRQILTEGDVNEILKPITSYSTGGSCISTHSFGLGAGYCRNRGYSRDEIVAYVQREGKFPDDVEATMCEGDDYWTWAGSYGSRFIYLRDQALTCVVFTNHGSYQAPNGNRISSRTHVYGHKLAGVLRKYFPALK